MEMTSVVVLQGHQLCQVYRRLRSVAAVQGVLAVATLPFVLFTPRVIPATVLLVLVLIGYAALKGRSLLRYSHTLKQLRLEERFLKEVTRGNVFQHLVSEHEHLWSTSRLWIGLRAVLLQPLPYLLLIDEKRRRIERHFHRAIRDLQPRKVNLHAPAFLVIVVFWDFARILEAADGVGFVVTAALFATILAFEALQTGLQWTVGRNFADLERALCAWTLANKFEQGFAPSGKHYVHRLLYEARPWFLSAGARTVSRSVRVDEALREVA